MIGYSKSAFRDKRLIWCKRLGLKEAVRIVRVNAGNDRIAAGFCDMEKACGGIRAVCAQTQQIELQRNVPLLCGQTQALHFPAVECFGAGEIDQIRVCQIGIQAGIQPRDTLVYISI